MLNKRKRWKTILGTSLAGILLASSLGYATTAGTKKMQEAWYGTINIIYNGQDKTAEFEPFVVDGTSYVPLRTMSDIFNKNLDWNEYTNTATVSDKVTENVEFWKKQIIIKDIEISELERKVEKLEKEVKDTSYISLRDMEIDLNKKYDRYERIDFEIFLKGDERNIDVRIETDLYDYRSRWDNLSNRDITNYIEDICDDILYEFPDANIDGYIRDTDDRKDLLTFYTTTRGRVVIDDDYRYYDDYDDYYDLSLRDLERELEDGYYDYFKDITLDIRLKGDSKYATFIIDIDYDYYKRKWNDLSDSQIKRLMSNIYDDIEYEWGRAEIDGYVYDTYGRSDLATYYKTSGGSEKFDRY